MPRYIDATDLVRRVLVERDKIPLEVVQRYSFGVPEPYRHGQAMRGGIRKALREIETSPTVDAVEVVRCKDCKLAEEFALSSQYVVCVPSARIFSIYGYCSYGMRKMDGDSNG